MSSVPRWPSSARVPSIGAEVITGEAIRTRRRAEPIADAIACASSAPWPGVNQARAVVPLSSSNARGSTLPERSTSRCSQSSAKFAAYAPASGPDSTATSTFSCRVQESTVQFADPVSTAARSRTAYLWCIRSGIPGTGRASIGSSARISGRVAGGGCRAGGRSESTL